VSVSFLLRFNTASRKICTLNARPTSQTAASPLRVSTSTVPDKPPPIERPGPPPPFFPGTGPVPSPDAFRFGSSGRPRYHEKNGEGVRPSSSPTHPACGPAHKTNKAVPRPCGGGLRTADSRPKPSRGPLRRQPHAPAKPTPSRHASPPRDLEPKPQLTPPWPICYPSKPSRRTLRHTTSTLDPLDIEPQTSRRLVSGIKMPGPKASFLRTSAVT